METPQDGVCFLSSIPRRGSGDTPFRTGAPGLHRPERLALAALAAEWRRTDADLATRIGHLDGSQGGGLNAGYRLNATTVHDDGAIDELFGEAWFDWFL
jgi:hypothetical protein